MGKQREGDNVQRRQRARQARDEIGVAAGDTRCVEGA
jgi:hypothetical protein